MAKKRANVSASFSADAKKIFDTLPPGTRTGVLEKLVLICVPIIRNEGTPAVLTDVEAMRSLLSRELGGVTNLDNTATRRTGIEEKPKNPRNGLQEMF